MDRSTVDDSDPNFRDRESRIAALVATFQAMLEAGERPNRSAFLSENADVAEELAGCLEALEYVGRVVPTAPLPTTPLSNSLVQGLTLGDFRIVKKIGSGGMGEVYEALQISLSRRVALKVLPIASSLDERALMRFRHEAQAAATLQHPHIVPIYSIGNVGDLHYFTMQFIEGVSLAHVVSTWQSSGTLTNEASGNIASSFVSSNIELKDRSLKGDGSAARVSTLNSSAGSESRSESVFRNIARIFTQAAEALQHAHDVGIIHRDVKPGNLLIDFKGDAWVADFGLAKLPESNLTGTTDLMGTIRYMSPEQASGKAITLDGRTDIYSLGVTLYETLALKPPFQADDRGTLLRKVLEEEPRPLRAVCREIPFDLDTITMKAMSKEPQDRYQTAAELAEDLRRFQNDRPILARPPTLQQRGRKWIKRNRVTVAVTTVITIAFLAVGSLGLLYGFFAIDRQRKDLQFAFEREKHLLREANDAKAEAVERLESEKLARASEQRIAYLQSVSLAYVEWRSANIEAAETLLAKCPVGLRGWEWRYIQQLCHQEHNVLPIESGYVQDILSLPTGELLVCDDNGVSVRSMLDGNEVGRWPPLQKGTSHNRTKITSDGKHVVRYLSGALAGAATLEGTPQQIIEGSSGKLIYEIPGSRRTETEMELSPNGSFVVSSALDSQINLWNIRARMLLKSIPFRRSTKIAFAPNGSSFAVGSTKKTISIFGAETGELLSTISDPSIMPLRGLGSPLQFSPDGRLLALGVDGGIINIFETTSRESVQRLNAKMGELGDFVFSPDGLWIATMNHADNSIRIWNVDTAELKRRITIRSSTPRKLQFSSDGMILTALSGKSNVSFWDLHSAEEGRLLGSIPRSRAFSGSQYAPCHVQVSPSGKWAAFYSGHRTDLYSMETQRLWKTIVAPNSDQVTRGVSFDESQGLLHQLSHHSILSWNLKEGTIEKELPITGSFSLFGNGVFSDDPDYNERNFASYASQRTFLGKDGRNFWVDGTKLGQRRENAKYICTATLIDDASRETSFFGTDKGNAYCLASSDDGIWVAAATVFDNKVLVWKTSTDHESWNIETRNRVLAMRFTLLGDLLGVADAAGKLRILDSENGSIVSSIAFPIQERVHFAFAHDGKRIAIAVGRSFDEEGEIRVCDVASGQTLIKIPLDSAAESVDFTPDGKQLLATDHKGRLWVFDSMPRSLATKVKDVEENRVPWHLDRVAEAESSKNYRAAIWHLDQLLVSHPDDVSYENRRSMLMLKTGEFADVEASALESLEKTLTLKSLPTAYRLSAEYFARGDWDAHQRLCRRVFALVTPQTRTYDASQIYRLGVFCPHGVDDLDKFIKTCEEKFSDGSSDSQFALPFLLGGAYYRAGRFAEAKTELTEMLTTKRSSPSFAIAWIFLAMTEKELGNDSLSKEAYESAEKRYAEVEASRKNGEVNFVVDHHYPLLKNEYKSLLNRK